MITFERPLLATLAGLGVAAWGAMTANGLIPRYALDPAAAAAAAEKVTRAPTETRATVSASTAAPDARSDGRIRLSCANRGGRVERERNDFFDASAECGADERGRAR